MDSFQRWIILAGEEGGPVSNKLGGIWEVIDAEARTLTRLAGTGEIDRDMKIIVAGPYYPAPGADWNRGKNRVTNIDGFDQMDMGPEMTYAIKRLKDQGIQAVTCQKTLFNRPVGYVLFNTGYYDTAMVSCKYGDISLSSMIKREAWELAGLDSLSFERMTNAAEYNHYLGLSHAVSELARAIVRQAEEPSEKYGDRAISEFARSLMPKVKVSLHCHEFGTFYALARLKSLGAPVRTVATLHATSPGRTAGYKSLEKIARNDKVWDPETPVPFATLEGLARFAEVVTFVGDSTMKEAMLFHNLNGIVVRNGIEVEAEGIDWAKKDKCRTRIQQFVASTLSRIYGGEPLNPDTILPIFTISRIEIENKGYPQLLNALMLQDRLLKHRVMGQRLAQGERIVCFLIASHGPKSKEKLPDGFPLKLTPEVLIWDEIRLNGMIKDRGLDIESLVSGKRMVSAVLYPQWVGRNDGGLNMTVDEIMAGCIAGIFPSQYEPFLLTGLEAGREGTPSIVSRSCGFSDALKKIKRLVKGMGGVVVVDNIEATPMETVLDYAMAMDYFSWTYLEDQVKYRLLCEESFSLAKQMNWRDPVLEYYRSLAL